MNKIYKVVWNKAKQMYVVVSEIVKSRTKTKSAKAVTKSVVTAGVLLAIGSQLGVAYAQKEEEPIIGRDNTLSDLSKVVILGYDNNLQKLFGTSIIGNHNTIKDMQVSWLFGAYNNINNVDNLGVFGYDNKVTNTDRTFIFGASNDLKDSVSTRVFGHDNKIYGTPGKKASDDPLKDERSVNNVFGNFNEIKGENRSNTILGFNNILDGTASVFALGPYNNVKNSKTTFINGTYNTINNSSFVTVNGILNKIEKTQSSSIVGKENEITDTHLSFISGFANKVNKGSNVNIIGNVNESTGNFNIVYGSQNKVDGQNIVVGHVNESTGKQNITNGIRNKVNGESNLILGNDTNLIGTDPKNKRTVKQMIVLGTLKSFGGKANGVGIGMDTSLAASKDVAIGHEATTTIADRTIDDSSQKINFFTNTNGLNFNISDKKFAGPNAFFLRIFSVGNEKNKARIVNVAPGRVGVDSTDAVNGSQLNAAYEAINYITPRSNENLTAVHDGSGVTYTLNKKITLHDPEKNTDTARDIILDSAAGTVNVGGSSGVTISGQPNNKTVSGLTNTTWEMGNNNGENYKNSNKAATESQVYNALNQAKTVYAGDDSATVERNLGQTLNIKGGAAAGTDNNIRVIKDGTDGLKIQLASTVSGLTSITATTGTIGGVNFDGNNVNLNNKPLINAGNITSTGTVQGKELVAKGGTNTVTVSGEHGTVTGLTNKEWTGQATSGRAATEDQLATVASKIGAASGSWTAKVIDKDKNTKQSPVNKDNNALTFKSGDQVEFAMVENSNEITATIKAGAKVDLNKESTIKDLTTNTLDGDHGKKGEVERNINNAGDATIATGGDIHKALGEATRTFGDGTNKFTAKLDETVAIVGGKTGTVETDKNITTKVNGKNIEISLNPELKGLTSVTATGAITGGTITTTGGKTTITDKGVTVKNDKDKVTTTIDKTGVDTNTVKVKDGETVTTTIDKAGINTNKITVGDKSKGVQITSTTEPGKDPVNTISNLSNTTWETGIDNGKSNYEKSSKAATEAQVYHAAEKAKNDAIAGSAWTIASKNGNDAEKTATVDPSKKDEKKVTIKNGTGIKVEQKDREITIGFADNTDLKLGSGTKVDNLEVIEKESGKPGEKVQEVKRDIVNGGDNTVATGGDIHKALANAETAYQGDNTDVTVTRKLGTTLNVKGGVQTYDKDKFVDGNIAVVGDKDKGELNLRIAKNLTGLTSVTATGDITGGKGIFGADTGENYSGIVINSGNGNSLKKGLSEEAAKQIKDDDEKAYKAHTINGLSNTQWKDGYQPQDKGQAATEGQLADLNNIVNAAKSTAESGWTAQVTDKDKKVTTSLVNKTKNTLSFNSNNQVEFAMVGNSNEIAATIKAGATVELNKESTIKDLKTNEKDSEKGKQGEVERNINEAGNNKIATGGDIHKAVTNSKRDFQVDAVNGKAEKLEATASDTVGIVGGSTELDNPNFDSSKAEDDVNNPKQIKAKNITTSIDKNNKEIKVALNKDIEVEKVKAKDVTATGTVTGGTITTTGGKTTITDSGVTVKDDSNNVTTTITKEGVDTNTVKVKDGNAVTTEINKEGINTNKVVAKDSIEIKNGNAPATTTIDKDGINTNKVTVGDKTNGVQITSTPATETGKPPVNTISNLSNTTWETGTDNGKSKYNGSNKAATEAQVYHAAEKAKSDAIAGSAWTIASKNGNDAEVSATVDPSKKDEKKVTIKNGTGIKVEQKDREITIGFADNTNLNLGQGTIIKNLEVIEKESGKPGEKVNEVKRDIVNGGDKTVATGGDIHKALANAETAYQGDNTDVTVTRKLGTALNVKGGVKTYDKDQFVDGNIAVVGDNNTGELNLRLAKNLTGLTSITATGAITGGSGIFGKDDNYSGIIINSGKGNSLKKGSVGSNKVESDKITAEQDKALQAHTINGLSNTKWIDGYTPADAGQAATEGQLADLNKIANAAKSTAESGWTAQVTDKDKKVTTSPVNKTKNTLSFNSNDQVEFAMDKNSNVITAKIKEGAEIKISDKSQIKDLTTNKEDGDHGKKGEVERNINNAGDKTIATGGDIHKALGEATRTFGDGTNNFTAKLDETVAVVGDNTEFDNPSFDSKQPESETNAKKIKAKNITTSIDKNNKEIKVALNKDIEVEKVKAKDVTATGTITGDTITTTGGKTTINDKGVTVKNDDNTVTTTIDKDGVDTNTVKVKDGNAVTTEINKEGINTNKVVANGSIEIKDGENDATTTINKDGINTNKVTVGDKTNGVQITSITEPGKEPVNTISNLSNTTWETGTDNGKSKYNGSNKAATESQVYHAAEKAKSDAIAGSAWVIASKNGEEAEVTATVNASDENTKKVTIKNGTGIKVEQKDREITIGFADNTNLKLGNETTIEDLEVIEKEGGKPDEKVKEVKRDIVNGGDNTVATGGDIHKALANAETAYQGDNTEVTVTRKLGTTLNVKGGVKSYDKDQFVDGNIAVVGDNNTGELNLRLAKNLTGLTTVTASGAITGGSGVFGKDDNYSGITINSGKGNSLKKGSVGSNKVESDKITAEQDKALQAHTINGLSNTKWIDGYTPSDAGQAATEGQLADLNTMVNEVKTSASKRDFHVDAVNGKEVELEATASDSVGILGGETVVSNPNFNSAEDENETTNPKQLKVKNITTTVDEDNKEIKVALNDEIQVNKVITKDMDVSGIITANMGQFGKLDGANVYGVQFGKNNTGNGGVITVYDKSGNAGITATSAKEDGKDTVNTMQVGNKGITITNDPNTQLKGAENEKLTNTISGLSNVHWTESYQPADESRAATEGQLKDLQGIVNKAKTTAEAGWTAKVDNDGTVNNSVINKEDPTLTFQSSDQIKFEMDDKSNVITAKLQDGATVNISKDSTIELDINKADGDKGKAGEVTRDINEAGNKHIATGGDIHKALEKAKGDIIQTTNIRIEGLTHSFATDNGEINDAKLTDKLNIKGGETVISTKEVEGKPVTKTAKNIETAVKKVNGKDQIEVALNKDIKVATVTAEDTINTKDLKASGTVSAEKLEITGKNDNNTNTITVNGKEGTITGLTNTKWDGKVVSGRAATEDQLKQVLEENTEHQFFGDGELAVKLNGSNNKLHLIGGADKDAAVTDGNIKVAQKDNKTLQIHLVEDVKGIQSISFKNNGPIITGGADEQSVGSINMQGGKITNLGDGVEDGDAVNYGQLRKNNAAIGRYLGELKEDIQETGALSGALAGLKAIAYDPYEPSQIMGAVGVYKGSAAVAIGLAHYKTEAQMVHAGVALGNRGTLMANVGYTAKFGNRGKKDSEYRKEYYAHRNPIDQVKGLTLALNKVEQENTELKATITSQNETIEEQNKRINQLEAQVNSILAAMQLNK